MTLKNTRGANLARWIREDPHAKGNVAAWCDHYSQFLEWHETPFNPQHIRNIAKSEIVKTESFGEKMARKIERAMGEPLYALDRPPASVEEPSTGYTKTRKAPESQRDSGDRIADAYKSMSPARRALADYAMRLKPKAQAP